MPQMQVASEGHAISGDATHVEVPHEQPNEEYDLVCVGFGPASLAIAVALHDRGLLHLNDGRFPSASTEDSTTHHPRILFIERQRAFAWHAGMLIPGSKMQISFLKDLATFRDPTSKFTFINYLHSKGRLAGFANLSTFLPLRAEFNDYLKWAASHFESTVKYGTEVVGLLPNDGRRRAIRNRDSSDGRVQSWNITTKDRSSGTQASIRARHVIVAAGGRPRLPVQLSSLSEDRLLHSSQYLKVIHRLDSQIRLNGSNYRIAVLGGGQSAAEIFDNLGIRYSKAQVTLYTSKSALKPSDDSPFVNQVFNPDRVSPFNALPSDARSALISDHADTNYGVVRPELLEKLYAEQYAQRLEQPDESRWRWRITTNAHLLGATTTTKRTTAALETNGGPADSLPGDDAEKTILRFRDPRTGAEWSEYGIDLVICATGYLRNLHQRLLEGAEFDELLLRKDTPRTSNDANGAEVPEPSGVGSGAPGSVEVGRDYRVRMRPELVDDRCGIWLQGYCEDSHGLSDTLLSILAVRAGELVGSIFASADRA